MTSKPESGRPRIVIVDDEPMVGDIVQAVLEASGYLTTLFTDPVPALAALEESGPGPDLLITDARMPQMSGHELIRQARRAHPGLKVILCGGDVSAAQAAGNADDPDAVLQKPFVPKALLDLVKSLLEG